VTADSEGAFDDAAATAPDDAASLARGLDNVADFKVRVRSEVLQDCI
jgi:hypothetical protein